MPENTIKIVSVNVGMPREVAWNGVPVLTAIFNVSPLPQSWKDALRQRAQSRQR
jgi:hypothetical protein